jgi:hypothetical protein
MMRHILGVLGVLAALVLLIVSMMMNYQFGYNLGKTHADGQIYGMASAAADCLKALAPFFFFAALRNRVWSQAAAAALVWIVVTVYAFTSALGHAAQNRFETSGNRVAASTSYKDTQAARARVEDQLKWIPPHRPASTVAAELNVLKAQRAWMTTKECSDITLKASREFCQQYGKLAAEHENGLEAAKLEAKLAELGAQTAKASKAGGAAVLGMADPQANLIARLTGVDFDTVQTGLMLFVALLIEIGSGFGMYVAFAYWRPNQSLHSIGEPAPGSKTMQAEPVRKEEKAEASEGKKDETQPAGKADPIWTAEPTIASADGKTGPPPPRPFGDNDNKDAPKWIMPENDVELFYKQGVRLAEGEFIVSQELYDGYKLWAKRKDKRPLNHSHFSKNFEKLGYKTVQIGGRQRYVGITLTPDLVGELEKKGARKSKSVLGHEGALPRPAAVSNSAADEATAQTQQLQAVAEEMHASIEPKPEAAPSKAKAA